MAMKTIVVTEETSQTPIVVTDSNTKIVFESQLWGCDIGILLDATKGTLDNIVIVEPDIDQCGIGIQSIGNKEPVGDFGKTGISGLRIEAGSVANCGDGLKLQCVWDGSIRDTRAYKCSRDGFDMTDSWNLNTWHIGATECNVGVKLPKWSSHFAMVAQVNREADIKMIGLEQCHLYPAYIEDRPMADGKYDGWAIYAVGCSDCKIDMPIVQRGHYLRDLVNCDVILRGQRGVGPELTTWRYRVKPSVVVENCRGGLWQWPTNGSIAMKASFVKQVTSNGQDYYIKASDKIPDHSTLFVLARGGRIHCNGKYQMFPSKIPAWQSLYLPSGGTFQPTPDTDVLCAFFVLGQVTLADVQITNEEL